MHTDQFIAYSNYKDTIEAINTTKDYCKSMQYYLQKSGKNAQQIKNIPEVDEEYYIDLTLECTLN